MNTDRLSRLAISVVAAFAVAGCFSSPQHQASYEAVAVNVGASTGQIGSWTVTLTRADVAFGPVYFCAAASGSSTLCAAAVSEIASVARFDALAQGPTPIGSVTGFTGPIRSASYDFGISWLDTSIDPTRDPSAPGRHSIQLAGEARNGSQVVPFTADIDLVPQYQGQNAVATAPVRADVTSEAFRLEVGFNPVGWLRQLDFDALGASAQRPIAISPGTPDHAALLVGIKSLAPPTFVWNPL